MIVYMSIFRPGTCHKLKGLSVASFETILTARNKAGFWGWGSSGKNKCKSQKWKKQHVRNAVDYARKNFSHIL